MSGLPWFRFYTEFLTDPKIQMMSETYQRRYVAILCLRGSNGDVTLHDDQVAFQMRISNEEWGKTKAEFLGRNIITNDNQPTAWNKRQYVSDSSAARVAKHRAKKKQQRNVTSNTPGTKSNSLDTDTDTDTDIDNKKQWGSEAIKKIFIHWQAVMDHKRSALDDKRKKLITKWLKTGYEPADLEKAITGCSLTPHNMGDNDRGERYDSIELILRDPAHIDRFMKNADTPPKQKKGAKHNGFSETDYSSGAVTPDWAKEDD